MLQHIKLPVSALRCLHPLSKETGRGQVVGTLAGRAEVRWAGDPPKASLPTPGVTPGRGAWGQPGVGQHPAAASSVMRNATPAISFTPGQHVPVNLW